MSGRAAVWLAWTGFGLYVLIVAATLGLVAAGFGNGDEAIVVAPFGFAVVGALVAARTPANPVGWLVLATAVAFGLPNLAEVYLRGEEMPGAVFVAWYTTWGWGIWLYTAGLLLPLLYPTGHLLSRRWRVAVLLGVLALVLGSVGAALAPGVIDVPSADPISNPLGVSGALAGVVATVGNIGFVLSLVGFVLSGCSVVLRLRRSRGRERQQLELFAYVGSLAVAGLFAGIVNSASGDSPPAWLEVLGGLGYISSGLLTLVGLPIAIGVAILRHRLYDIDVVITRTLIYGVLTVTLALAYLASVLVLRLLLDPVTGESDLAVAGSTLAVAALFRPARRRIQALVDRRFYRKRYDAARTLEAFTGRLRDELDLEALGTDLRRVVADTVQPAHVSLWLREKAP